MCFVDLNRPWLPGGTLDYKQETLIPARMREQQAVQTDQKQKHECECILLPCMATGPQRRFVATTSGKQTLTNPGVSASIRSILIP